MSAPGSAVKFKLRATYSAAGASSGSASLEYSCATGQAGTHTYDLTSSQLSSATGGDATVLVYGGLRIIDDDTRAAVECTAWTLKVSITGNGPRGAVVTFTIFDANGLAVWTSGPANVPAGSVRS